MKNGPSTTKSESPYRHWLYVLAATVLLWVCNASPEGTLPSIHPRSQETPPPVVEQAIDQTVYATRTGKKYHRGVFVE